MIDHVSDVTGYSISVGYIDKDNDFGIGSGFRALQGQSGNITGTDTMLLGSGTKPYTAAAIMRLVD